MYLPKRNFKKKQTRGKGSNQSFYKSAQWKKVRAAYLSQFPLDQIADYCGDILAERIMIVDHIIPIELGGAKYDPRNFQTLTKSNHETKSALERNRGGCLVNYTVNQDGYYIPLNKSDCWKILKPYYELKKETGQYTPVQ